MILYMKRPSTKGIFRLAASKGTHRQLKEAVYKGGDVVLEGQSVHLLAVILKVNSSDFKQ